MTEIIKRFMVLHTWSILRCCQNQLLTWYLLSSFCSLCFILLIGSVFQLPNSRKMISRYGRCYVIVSERSFPRSQCQSSLMNHYRFFREPLNSWNMHGFSIKPTLVKTQFDECRFARFTVQLLDFLLITNWNESYLCITGKLCCYKKIP